MNTNTIIKTVNDADFAWKAVLAGLFSSSAVGALLALLGIAIGAALLQPDASGISMVGIGSLVWFVLSGIITLWMGGALTGYFSETVSKARGALHGLVMWSLSLLVGLILSVYGAGVLVAGAGQLIGNTVKIASVMAAQVVPGDKIEEAQGDAKEMIDQLLGSKDGNLNNVKQAFEEYMNNKNAQTEEQLKQNLATLVTQNSSLNQAQAEEKIQDLKDKAMEATEEASSQISKMAFFAFFAMVTGAFAAALGGAYGAGLHNNHRRKV